MNIYGYSSAAWCAPGLDDLHAAVGGLALGPRTGARQRAARPRTRPLPLRLYTRAGALAPPRGAPAGGDSVHGLRRHRGRRVARASASECALVGEEAPGGGSFEVCSWRTGGRLEGFGVRSEHVGGDIYL